MAAELKVLMEDIEPDLMEEEELKDFFYNELRDKYIAFAKTKYPEAVGI